jgi:ribose/xylose/arabinose/galactoside ABC-type transport system permease subunit/ABC-type multidrug transport system ATPase subunit
MVGRAGSTARIRDRSAESGPGLRRSAEVPRLQVHGLSDRQGRFRDLWLEARAGEIVGVYGLVGAGRSEFAQALFGLRAGVSGSVLIDGTPLPLGSPAAAVRAGIAYVPEDRLRQGLCRGLSVQSNLLLATLAESSLGPWRRPWRERAIAATESDALAIRRRSLAQPIGQLSGGNQQKVVLGRWLLTEPRVLLLDEPTRGVDVGAKREIHRIVRERAEAGAAVILISSELPEVLENADRIVVFREGAISGELVPDNTTAAQVAAKALPTSGVEAVLPRGHAKRPRPRFHFRPEWGLLGILGIFALVLALTAPAFATADNLVNLLTSASVTTILALGASMVIIAGGIDISVGSLLALAAAACGLALKLPHSPLLTIPVGIACGLAVGLAGGLINGGLSLIGRVHPIVITLGTMTIYRGMLIGLTGGNAITDLPDAFDNLAHGNLGGVEGAIWIMAATVVAAHVWLGYARYGRYQYAIGSSPTAARLAGISRGRAILVAFGAGGLLAGLAGIVELAKSGSMQSGLGVGYELQAIAAAVIGGTAVSGGRGTAVGTFLGALLLSLVSNSLVLWEVSRYQSGLVIGSLILVAVIFDRGWRRLET